MNFKMGTLYYFPFRLQGKWTPNYEGLCAMTLTIMDGDKLTRFKNAGAVKKYSVKNNSAISRKPEKELRQK